MGLCLVWQLDAFFDASPHAQKHRRVALQQLDHQRDATMVPHRVAVEWVATHQRVHEAQGAFTHLLRVVFQEL